MINIRCSVCKQKANKLVEVMWKNKQVFYPRCDEHITDGYRGLIVDINPKNFAPLRSAKTNKNLKKDCSTDVPKRRRITQKDKEYFKEQFEGL